ncbi:unnamed protein product [Linum trigynum]|uniref:Replication factor A C-terminal domain-containing protein n=1 Tax=Linum trigynum TaxID=586398 RepID=A0AAV2E1F7_9ROSI
MAHQVLQNLKQQNRFTGTIRCRVSRIWEAINTNNGRRLHLDMILIDEQGTDIWCQIPASSIHRFQNRLQEQQIYDFRDFKVSVLKENFRPCNNQLFIQFEPDTVVTHVAAVAEIPAFSFNFIKYDKIAPRSGQNRWLIDAVGHLKNYSELKTTSLIRTTSRKELHIQLAEGPPVRVTIWDRVIDQFDAIIDANGTEEIVLVITSVWVKKQQGEDTLSATGATKLYANMDIPEVIALRNRNHGIEVPALIPQNQPPEIPAINIKDLASLEAMENNMNQVFSVRGTVLGIKPKWFYMGCATCPIKVEPDMPEYSCTECQAIHTKAIERYRFHLIVKDNTGRADFIILDRAAHRFFGIEAEKLCNTSTYEKDQLPSILLQVVNMQLKFHIRLTNFNYTHPKTEYTVINITDTPIQGKVPQKTTNEGSSSNITGANQGTSSNITGENSTRGNDPKDIDEANPDSTEPDSIQTKKKPRVIISDDED